MQQARLHVLKNGPLMFARGRQDAEEKVKTNQGNAARQPATEEFTDEKLAPRQRLGQQREKRAVLPFHGNLPRGRGDGNHQRTDPDEQQADFLQVTDNVVVMENIDRSHDRANERREEEQHVRVLSTVELLDHDVGNGDDVVHGVRGCGS
jgi:hypothetical protein